MIGKLTRRWLMFAALVLAVAALTAAGCGGDDDSGGGGGVDPRDARIAKLEAENAGACVRVH